MAENDKLECNITVERVRFYNPDTCFGIIVASVNEVNSGKPILDKNGYLIAKGNMAEPLIGRKYELLGTETVDPKWGPQYKITSMYTPIAFDENDTEGQREFLLGIFTENQVQEMYNALENPYESLLEKRAEDLIKVYGCGSITAAKWIKKFHKSFKSAKVIMGLKEYGLTFTMAEKLLKAHKQSSDLVIEKVRKNPYLLMELDGFGWKRCDELAIKGGISRHSAYRVEAFIKYYLNMMAESGYTYVYANSQLMEALLESLGEDIPDEPITEAIHHLREELWWSSDCEKVGLNKYIRTEKKIASKLNKLRNSDNNFEYDGWERKLQDLEEEQGWFYTDEQWTAIKSALVENVVLITGYAGTGKSTVISAILNILSQYKYAQCALAGRAAARLAEITKSEGFTIHRLLGYPKGPEAKGNFAFYEHYDEDGHDISVYLDYDIIILDEISMVDSKLFLRLIQAIKPGSKLIMLGDIGQLESIGCGNIAHDLILSPEITSVQLTKIHRQAESSAIITESVKVRQNTQLIEKDWTGEETRGELQDLTYECYLDANNTFFKIMQRVSILLSQDIPILDMQVIVPLRERGNASTWNLNLAIQEIYNPEDPGKPEILISLGPGKQFMLRLGDKVINTKNNYRTTYYSEENWKEFQNGTNEEDQICPTFNGNIGIVTKIDKKQRIAVIDYMDIGEVIVSGEDLTAVQLGYAITCHKLQGSETKYAIVGLDFSAYSLLTKEWVYTAMTRAKEHCWMIAQSSALRYAVAQNGVSKKQTLLVECLHNVTHPKIEF